MPKYNSERSIAIISNDRNLPHKKAGELIEVFSSNVL